MALTIRSVMFPELRRILAHSVRLLIPVQRVLRDKAQMLVVLAVRLVRLPVQVAVRAAPVLAVPKDRKAATAATAVRVMRSETFPATSVVVRDHLARDHLVVRDHPVVEVRGHKAVAAPVAILSRWR